MEATKQHQAAHAHRSESNNRASNQAMTPIANVYPIDHILHYPSINAPEPFL
jgi:hypothetical protein